MKYVVSCSRYNVFICFLEYTNGILSVLGAWHSPSTLSTMVQAEGFCIITITTSYRENVRYSAPGEQLCGIEQWEQFTNVQY